MLQKVVSNYTTPVSKFKINPRAILKESEGEAVAVTANNEIEFYVVPAKLFEEMTEFCEYAQRGTANLTPLEANAKLEGVDVEKLAQNAATKLKEGSTDDGATRGNKPRIHITRQEE